MTYLIINTEPIEEKHLGWNIINHDLQISLEEIVICKYKHPQAPEHAFIEQIETRIRRKVDRIDIRNSCDLIILENALQVVSNTERDKK